MQNFLSLGCLARGRRGATSWPWPSWVSPDGYWFALTRRRWWFGRPVDRCHGVEEVATSLAGARRQRQWFSLKAGYRRDWRSLAQTWTSSAVSAFIAWLVLGDQRDLETLLVAVVQRGGVVAGMFVPILVVLFGLAIPLGPGEARMIIDLHAVVSHWLTGWSCQVCPSSMPSHAALFRFTSYDGLQLRDRTIAVSRRDGAALVGLLAALVIVMVDCCGHQACHPSTGSYSAACLTPPEADDVGLPFQLLRSRLRPASGRHESRRSSGPVERDLHGISSGNSGGPTDVGGAR